MRDVSQKFLFSCKCALLRRLSSLCPLWANARCFSCFCRVRFEVSLRIRQDIMVCEMNCMEAVYTVDYLDASLFTLLLDVGRGCRNTSYLKKTELVDLQSYLDSCSSPHKL